MSATSIFRNQITLRIQRYMVRRCSLCGRCVQKSLSPEKMPVLDHKCDDILLVGNVKIPNICAKVMFNPKIMNLSPGQQIHLIKKPNHFQILYFNIEKKLIDCECTARNILQKKTHFVIIQATTEVFMGFGNCYYHLILYYGIGLLFHGS